jgi:hypothetical protein
MNLPPVDVMLLPPILTIREAIEIQKKIENEQEEAKIAPLKEQARERDPRFRRITSKLVAERVVVSTSPPRTASVEKKRFSIEITVSPQDSPAALTRRNSAASTARLSRSMSGGVNERNSSSDETIFFRKSANIKEQ